MWLRKTSRKVSESGRMWFRQGQTEGWESVHIERHKINAFVILVLEFRIRDFQSMLGFTLYSQIFKVYSGSLYGQSKIMPTKLTDAHARMPKNPTLFTTRSISNFVISIKVCKQNHIHQHEDEISVWHGSVSFCVWRNMNRHGYTSVAFTFLISLLVMVLAC